MSNIPGGANAIPGVYSDVVTQSRAVSVPGGSRIAAIIGEGSTDEVIVSQASGGGIDGLNSSYTSTTGADGRHFLLSNAPLISNRTTLYKNGVPLVGVEALIDNNSFSAVYDYRLDITTGEIELQTAHLFDQGGALYVPVSTNVGLGTINGLTLVDVNAPPETWTVRCISVQRDISNNPVGGTAKFLAFGSVSGAKLDGYGNPVLWKADGYTVSNSVLSFSILETMVGPSYTSPFREGDAFTIKVASGVLVRGDSLTANYIPQTFINDPVLNQGQGDVTVRHGSPSLTNNLSLGAQLLFANSAPAVYSVQAAPAMPRRQSYVLSTSVKATSVNDDDFIFPLPLGVVPDINSPIHFFVTNNTTHVETQILPNKFPFYTLGTAGKPTTHAFIIDNTSAPAGNAYSYSVNSASATMATGTDGYLLINPSTPTVGVFSSATTFDSTYVGKSLKIIDATTVGNVASYTVNSVVDGKLHITVSGSNASEGSIRYEVLDSSRTSYYVVINHLVVPDTNQLRVTIVDTKDASFYDAGWINALTSLEVVECDIVVPLPKQTISAIFQNTLAHCRTMSNVKNKKERMLFCGAISGLTPSNLTGATPAAVEDIGILEGIQGDSVTEVLAGNVEDLANYSVPNAFGGTYRCAYFAPDQIVVNVGGSNLLIDGFYQAAAAAGYLSADLRLENPLTNKILSGYTILRNKQYSNTILEQLIAAGVCIVQPVTGGGRVISGITTTQSGYPEEQEISIIFIRDRVAKTLRAGFAGYIGTPSDDNTDAVLNQRALGLLDSLVGQKLITGYRSLSVVRDTVDPRQFNLSVLVAPTYGINWIYIRVGVGQL